VQFKFPGFEHPDQLEEDAGQVVTHKARGRRALLQIAVGAPSACTPRHGSLPVGRPEGEPAPRKLKYPFKASAA
jgi:hypothetical protein